jgi:predicted metal-dependent hydrolase
MITNDSITFGSTKINYSIVYSHKRKNATLAVYPMKQVEISVPKNTEQELIQKLVKKKAKWIVKQVLWFNEISQLDSAKEQVNGETYLYGGRQYRLKIEKVDGKAYAEFTGRQLIVKLPTTITQRDIKKTIKAAIWDLYRKQSEEKVSEIVKRFSRKLGMSQPNFMIKNQFKRWGSCTSKNLLIFNFRIVMAPMSQIEYVVAHELCHIKHKDHSTKYWKQLRVILPDYEIRKENLRKDGWQYSL